MSTIIPNLPLINKTSVGYSIRLRIHPALRDSHANPIRSKILSGVKIRPVESRKSTRKQSARNERLLTKVVFPEKWFLPKVAPFVLCFYFRRRHCPWVVGRFVVIGDMSLYVVPSSLELLTADEHPLCLIGEALKSNFSESFLQFCQLESGYRPAISIFTSHSNFTTDESGFEWTGMLFDGGWWFRILAKVGDIDGVLHGTVFYRKTWRTVVTHIFRMAALGANGVYKD